MLKNYFKTAWRNLFMNRFYSLINITGLTIGLAIGMLILLWVQDEESFDRFHAGANNIYQVNSPNGTGANKTVWNTTQAPVATYALKEIPGVKNAVRILKKYQGVFTYGDKLFQEENSAFVDPSFFSMFDFKLVSGNVKMPFPNNNCVIITRTIAEKYFGTENVIGKIIREDHNTDYEVAGVIEDFPGNSSIRYDMLFPMSLVASDYTGENFWKSLDSDWGNFGYRTFLEIEPQTSLKKIGEQLIRIQLVHAPHIKVTVADNAFQLQPFKEIHLVNADGSKTAKQQVSIFFFTAILILLIACINYVNLSTARAMVRAKEVSIRKITGAGRSQLFIQFITESVLFFLISLVFALGLMWILLPLYNSVSGKQLGFNFFDPVLWKVAGVTLSCCLVASSIYPAMLLSSFEPLKALKGKIVLGIGNSVFRKVLVTGQFVFSVVLIIGTIIIGRQLTFIREKDPGYERSQVLSFASGEIRNHMDAARSDLKTAKGIDLVAVSATKLENSTNTTGGVDWDGKNPDNMFVVHTMGMDENFIPMMKMKFAQGSGFTGTGSDSAHYILNETAVRLTGIKDPIGKRFKLQEQEGIIIGVLKDFNFASLKEKIEPLAMFYQPAGRYLYIKTNGKNAAAAIRSAKTTWDRYNPGFPFQYRFLDEAWGKLYASEERTGRLFSGFSIIAILISCLGLFGLSTYTAQTMTKEIGIRKVLGAGVGSILALISKDFIQLILLSILIASPLAWYAMNSWLEEYVFRIEIGASVFLLAAGLIVLVALITISFQSVRAAVANPVKALRS